MNWKKITSVFLLYFFAIALLPLSFLSNEVKALENKDLETYNNTNTTLGNQYSLSGPVYKVAQYQDYSVVLTDTSMYFIKDGSAKKYNLGKVEKNSNINRSNTNFFLTPYYHNMGYKMLRIDTNEYKGYEDYIESYLPFLANAIVAKQYNLLDFNIDSNHTKWFSVVKSSLGNESPTYKLLSSSNKESFNEVAVLTGKPGVHFDDAFTSLAFDKDNNVWFKYTESTYTDVANIKKYMLGRVKTDKTMSFISFSDSIRDYKIALDGTVWALSKNKITHVTQDGATLNTYDAEDGKALTLDQSGAIWLLDNGSIKKFEQNSFARKFEVPKDRTTLSVYTENKLTAGGTRGVSFINGNSVDNVNTTSAIKSWVKVVKNAPGKVLSQSNNAYSDDYSLKDQGVYFSESTGDGKFKLNFVYDHNPMDFSGATAYNNDVYIPYGNSIYKLGQVAVEEYVRLTPNTNSIPYLSQMEFDNSGNIFAMDSATLYKIDSAKAVQTINIDSLLSKDASNKKYDYSFFTQLLKDAAGNMYVTLKQYSTDHRIFAKTYIINNFNTIKEVQLQQPNSYLANMFLNEKQVPEFVFFDNTNKHYKVMQLDTQNNLSLDSRFENQNDSLNEKYPFITCFSTTSDGKSMLMADFGGLYIKEKQDLEFKHYTNDAIGYFTSTLVPDNKGGIYISGSNGLLYFKGSTP